ncbi:barstar family protein [Glycomyces terrestris]|uniref:Barstar (barnase inhibitor) domain-containing protein n=1 Tax=Glycomyces terrestris TaxID=2493553 RepID=A0A426UZR0_9ACTN|nr:barstar family protein [Glycomyces terrestris]RRS00093.1 hypothetical protein EIW28_05710 [Glycomyces terrestris]
MGEKLQLPGAYRGSIPVLLAIEESNLLRESGDREREFFIEIDGSKIAGPVDIFTMLGRKVHLHPYLGRNWDALAEALVTVGEALEADRVVLIIRHAELLATKSWLPTFVRVMCHASESAGAWCNDEGEPYDGHRFALRVLLVLKDGSFDRFRESIMSNSDSLRDYYGVALRVVAHGSATGFRALTVDPENRGYF